MPSNKTYILDDIPTEFDVIDFTSYVESLMDVCKTAHTTRTSGIFGKRKI